MSWIFTAMGKPKPKGRPRMTRRGRVYTPQTTLEAEADIASQYEGPVHEGPVAVTVNMWNDRQVISIEERPNWENHSRLRGDIDNCIKLTLDALNRLAWLDDKQVVEIHAYKR